MNREQQDRPTEPRELGIASVETQGASWQVPEFEGYMVILGISQD